MLWVGSGATVNPYFRNWPYYIEQKGAVYSYQADRVIYLGCPDPSASQANKDAVFYMPEGGVLSPEANKVTVYGVDPFTNIQMLYTTRPGVNADHGRFTTLTCVDPDRAIFHYLRANVHNAHGVVCGQSGANVKVEFHNSVIHGVECCHNEGAVGTYTLINNCEVILQQMSDADSPNPLNGAPRPNLNGGNPIPSEKLAHCNNAELAGTVTVIKRDALPTSGIDPTDTEFETQQIINLTGTTAALTVKEGANVTIVVEQDFVDFIAFTVSGLTISPRLTMESNAYLNLDMAGKFQIYYHNRNLSGDYHY